MSTAVVAYESASLNDRMKYAQTLAAAGDLIPKGLWSPVQRPDGSMGAPAPSPGKVLLVMETGAMLGLMPAAALQSIDVVEGRATLSARLMGALIRKAGHKLEVLKSGSIPTGDYSVTVTGTRADDGSTARSAPSSFSRTSRTRRACGRFGRGTRTGPWRSRGRRTPS